MNVTDRWSLDKAGVQVSESFQRARTDQQRDQRRHEILATTRQMLTGRRVADVSLNEIARQVGLAKSNVLRYFGSREAILLVLLALEYDAWVDEVASAMPQATDPDPVERAAGVLASTAAARPLLCELLTAAPTVLEHNVTPEEVITFKLAVQASMQRLLASLATELGPWDSARQGIFLGALHALITGLWALAHPSPALTEAMTREPRIQGLPSGMERDTHEALATLIAGLRVRGPHPTPPRQPYSPTVPD